VLEASSPPQLLSPALSGAGKLFVPEKTRDPVFRALAIMRREQAQIEV
jgi:protein-L-isoaspartate O-methyltransferase